MRKFYQIYYDGLYWYQLADTVVKITSAIQNECLATINTLEQDSHQYIIRFTCSGVNGTDKIKMGYNFVQVSSPDEDRVKKLFDLVMKFITTSDDNEKQNVPF